VHPRNFRERKAVRGFAPHTPHILALFFISVTLILVSLLIKENKDLNQYCIGL